MPAMSATVMRAVLVWCIALSSFAGAAWAGPIEEAFKRHKPGSASTVDNTAWDGLLKAYVVTDRDGLNRVDYAAWKASGHAALQTYIQSLERTDPGELDQPEQFAFWVNLYNAKTIDIVLAKYPVRSIKDISLGGSLFSAITGGPWKAKVVRVAGQDLSLDDIEHVILRPLFGDPRIHYAVNCASVGCPNLGREAFVGARLEAQLDAAARAYVNSARGASIAGGKIIVSSIYNWFSADFGGTPEAVLAHLRRYAQPELRTRLEARSTIDDYVYDWTLNDARR